MRRLALIAVLVAVPAALASPVAGIQPTSIVGAKLGLRAAVYKRFLFAPVRKDVLENDYSRLVFTKRKLSVYFRGRADRGVEITTWNKAYTTFAGVGPCTSVATLRKAYGKALKVWMRPGTGKILAFTLGKLIFATNDGKHVTVVALGSGTAAIDVALSETPCS